MGHSAVRPLADVETGATLRADVLIIGGGPAGLTLARGLADSRREVLILESGGLDEDAGAEELNRVAVAPGNWTDEQVAKRRAYHGDQTRLWDHDRQGYGVRCRLLGGSTQSWAGKSAAFDDIDFAARDWVPNSGWPISARDLDGPLDRAAEVLNLGLNCYDDGLWHRLRRDPPRPTPDPERLRSFFWQFARSTLSPMEVMQAGREFLAAPPANARVLTGATVTGLETDAAGRRVCAVRAVDAAGRAHRITARSVVLAASAIENARLLLIAREGQGLGNAHDQVGRCLMDHPCAVVGAFRPADIARMSVDYGFFGLKTGQGATMYMRGLAPTARLQRDEGLLNCAGFMPGERAADDPLPALRRLIRRDSAAPWQDMRAVARSPGIVAMGLGRMALQSRHVPAGLSRFAVNQVVRFRPGVAAEEYLTGGMPHKLVGLSIQAVCEQVPDPANRVSLGTARDRHGVPLPQVRWQVGEMETRTLARFGRLLGEEFGRAGLPVPELAGWIAEDAPAPVIDMAHSAGTTRMAADPRRGVVDADCRVHGVDNLHVAGASVFATSGHANPTLMICALAMRLADHLAADRAGGVGNDRAGGVGNDRADAVGNDRAGGAAKDQADDRTGDGANAMARPMIRPMSRPVT